MEEALGVVLALVVVVLEECSHSFHVAVVVETIAEAEAAPTMAAAAMNDFILIWEWLFVLVERKSVVGEADKLVCSECVLLVDGRKKSR